MNMVGQLNRSMLCSDCTCAAAMPRGMLTDGYSGARRVSFSVTHSSRPALALCSFYRHCCEVFVVAWRWNEAQL